MLDWDEIQSGKRELERKEDELESLQQQVRQTGEFYEESFFYQRKLFNELQENFSHSKTKHLYEEMAEQIQLHKRGIKEILEEQQEGIKKEKRAVEDKKEEFYFQERRIAQEEKEGENEH